jgi:anti-sigma factor RsiW
MAADSKSLWRGLRPPIAPRLQTRYLGAAIAVFGLSAVVYLASIGQATAAAAMGTSVATLVAVIVGKKIL